MAEPTDPESTDKPQEPDAPRERADTFVKRKAEAREVGVNTAFVDGLTADLLLEGIPEDKIPAGAPKPGDEVEAGDKSEKKADEAVDADALFDEPPESAAATSGSSSAKPAETDAKPKAELPKPKSERSGSVAPPKKTEIAEPSRPAPLIEKTPAPKAPPPGETPSSRPNAPFNPATLAIGGAVLAVVLLLAVKTCPSAPDATTTDGAAKVAGKSAADEGGGGADDLVVADDEGGAGAGARAEGGGGGAAGGADEAADDDDAAGGGGAAKDTDAAADDDGAAGGAADDTAGQAAADAKGASDGDVVVDETDDEGQPARPDDDDGGGGGDGGKTWTPTDTKQQDAARAAEQAMTAEELLALAKESLKQKKYRDAYRQSGSSYNKKKTDAALEVRVKAACGMKDKAAAKAAFDKLPSGPDRRELRSKCRDQGVRLGL